MSKNKTTELLSSSLSSVLISFRTELSLCLAPGLYSLVKAEISPFPHAFEISPFKIRLKLGLFVLQ